MKNRFKQSLISQISIVIIFVEVISLLTIGIYYINRFSTEIDKRIVSQIKIPGILMNRQLLRYESVADPEIMTELVGETFVEGLVVDLNQTIYYSTNPELVGKNISELPNIDLQTLQNAANTSFVSEVKEDDNVYLTSWTPLFAYEGGTPFFYVYIKVKTNNSQKEKLVLAELFLLGSILCIVASSLGLIIIMRRIIIHPIRVLQSHATRLAKGKLNDTITIQRSDEIGELTKSFGQMRDAIRGQIQDLNKLNIQIEAQNQDLQKHKEGLEDLVSQRTQELATAKDEAEAASQAKSNFLSMMSHEIRTPLHLILGFAEIVKTKMSNPSLIHYLESIQSSGQSLLGLINDILDFSKVEAGKMTLEYGPVSLKKAFHEIQAVFELALLEKPVDLIVTIPDDLPSPLFLDEIRLRQVMTNLISNAIKFTETGYIKVQLQWGYSDETQTDVVDLMCSVEDTGIGIPKDQLNQIFEAFTQVEGQKLSQYGGTGLGLSLSKYLVELMGGGIRIESQVGVGSTFTINLYKVQLVTKHEDELHDLTQTKIPLLPSVEKFPNNHNGDFSLLVGDPLQLPKLLDVLQQEVIPQWERLKKKQPIKDATQFGELLENLGKEYGVDDLIRLGNDILFCVDKIDIIALRNKLSRFSAIVTQLRNYNVESKNSF